MSRRLARYALLLLALCMLEATACTADRAGSRGENGFSTEANQVAALLANGGLRHACGSPPPLPATSILVLTARECLSCIDLGPMLRELARRDTALRTQIVTTQADAGEVCEYLGREKVRMRVLASDRITRPAQAKPVLRYVALDSTGRVTREAAALIPEILLDSITN
jgi:hypothetical protein